MYRLQKAARDLLARPWTVQVVHIFRKANFAADGSAILGKSLLLCYHLLEDPPPELFNLLHMDYLLPGEMFMFQG